MNQIFEKIENLFSRELKLVVKREQENENKIHLYKVGQYWAAFDQSAYLLEQLMGEEDEPAVLQLKEYPFPLVMHNIHSVQVEELCDSHHTTKRGVDYLQLMTAPINDKAYHRWYKNYLIENCIMAE
jgi:hypothetical protein